MYISRTRVDDQIDDLKKQKIINKKIVNLLDDTTNQLSKFRTRNWVEINGESKGKYYNSNIRF